LLIIHQEIEKKVDKLLIMINEPMQVEGISHYDKIDPSLEIQHKINNNTSILDDHLSTQICDKSLENTTETMEEPPKWEWQSCSKTFFTKNSSHEVCRMES
jgi:hypothetical protein